MKVIIERARSDLAPALGFKGESTFEVFFSEYMGLHGDMGSEVVAVYCNGTSSRPIIEISLAHELGHAYQESLGLDYEHAHGFNEDDAEDFGVTWADYKEIRLWLLDPEAPNHNSKTLKP